MARVVHYRHCRLVKPVATGEKVVVSWISEPFAEVGRVLKLKGSGGWEDGWVVREAGSRRLTAAQLPDFHELSKAHLRATGDAETA
jgi:hypothetical protein